MRQKVECSGLVGLAVSGTYVVILGWDITDPTMGVDLLGFAIRRTDKTEGEEYWLRGMKTFPGSTPLPVGGTASSPRPAVPDLPVGRLYCQARP